MSIFEAIVYGIVQGLGEFLPISSTAHLTLLPWIFGWKDPSLTFDVALHLGTLVAVTLYFWKDWLTLLGAGIKGTKTSDGKLFWFLVLATIPGALFAVAFEKDVESKFRNPALIGVMLIIMGLILYAVDKYSKKKVNLEKIGLNRSLLIGISQALALIPGVSRSGITITAGLFTGLTRESAAKFSFYLSAPIIVGGVIFKLDEILNPQVPMIPFITAIVTSAAVGILSIKFLLNYLKNRGFGIFTGYRLVLGIIVITLYIIR